jgi:cobalt/nickel transport system permease protein
MHHQIDSLAYTNKLRSLPPEHKLLFAIVLFVIGYAVCAPVQLSIAFWLGIWTVVYAGIPLRIYLKMQAIPFGFWLISVPPLAIGGVLSENISEVQADIWRGIPIGSFYLYVSKYGLTQASELFARAIALTSCLYFILFTIPFAEILRLLRSLGCPTLITELLSLMYRFIFLLTDTATELLTAQQARLGYRTWGIGMKSLSLLVSQLLWRTLENYRQISLGLTSRGFTGELRMWHSRPYKPNPRYILEAFVGCLILVLGIRY